jgi:hypothetical protein
MHLDDMDIRERPEIEAANVHSHDNGYRARTLCVADGHPAEVSLDVNYTDRGAASTYRITVFDWDTLRWIEVYALSPAEVGTMPMIPADAVVRLNEVATTLWQVATIVLRTARLRVESRVTFPPREIEPVDDFDPLASGDHDAAEFAADEKGGEK